MHFLPLFKYEFYEGNTIILIARGSIIIYLIKIKNLKITCTLFFFLSYNITHFNSLNRPTFYRNFIKLILR